MRSPYNALPVGSQCVRLSHIGCCAADTGKWNACGRNTSSCRNRSSVTEGAAGEKDCRIESATPWDRPVERREVTYGLSYRRLENRIVVKAFLVSAIYSIYINKSKQTCLHCISSTLGKHIVNDILHRNIHNIRKI